MDLSIEQLLGTKPCDCGRCATVGTERVEVTRGLAEAVRREAAGAGVILFGDGNTLAACGNALGSSLGPSAKVVELAPSGVTLHAGEHEVARVRSAIEAAPGSLPVAVGAGTINDLVKAACHDLGRSYVSVATAPSMNGYTSAIAAITVGGLKSTLASTPPVAVLADPGVLARSPLRLAASGLADLVSKPVSTADWKLEHLLWDSPFCPTPAGLAGAAVERAVAVAEGVRAGETGARRTLFDALLLSGVSMAVAGSSSPASGGEHLISHFLDMTADVEPGGPREPALHGEQVGVATRVTTRLYREVFSLDAGSIDWDRAARLAPDRGAAAMILQGEPWMPEGLRESFLEQSGKKFERTGDPGSRVARIRDRWPRLVAELGGVWETGAVYAEAAAVAGAPVSPAEIGVASETFRRAYRLARFLRDRYTILDLAGDLGLLEVMEPRVLTD